MRNVTLARAPWAPWVLFALYGVPYAMTEGMARAYVVDLVPQDCRGSAIGGFTLVGGLAALPASAMAGALWDLVSHPAPFWVSSALMLAAAAGVALAGPVLTPPERVSAA